MRTIVALLATLAALGGAEGQDARKLDLRWNWEKGRELLYRNAQKQTMEAGGAAIEQEMATTYSLTVQELGEKGEATLLVKYEALAAKGSGFVEYDYDSEKDKDAPDDPQVASMAKLVGQSFTLRITPKGKVLEVNGFSKILDLLMKDIPDGPQADVARAMMKQSFSDDMMKSNFQQMVPVLPETPVGPGDAWKDEFTYKLPMIGSMKFGIASTLLDLKDGAARIGQDYTIELKGDEKPDPANPLAGMVQIKQCTAKAVLLFSQSDGCFTSQAMDLAMVISAGGQEIPMKTRTELKRVERKAKKKDF